jgi:hypothetical protein
LVFELVQAVVDFLYCGGLFQVRRPKNVLSIFWSVFLTMHRLDNYSTGIPSISLASAGVAIPQLSSLPMRAALATS